MINPLPRTANPFELTFIVPGEPVAWQRTGHAPGRRADGTLFVRPFTPEETTAYEAKVRTFAKIATNQARWTPHPDDRFTVVLRIFRRYEGKGGDLDNYVKAVFDGMNEVIFPDDRYIRRLAVDLSGPDSKPRVEVLVRRHRRGEHPRVKRKGST